MKTKVKVAPPQVSKSNTKNVTLKELVVSLKERGWTYADICQEWGVSKETSEKWVMEHRQKLQRVASHRAEAQGFTFKEYVGSFLQGVPFHLLEKLLGIPRATAQGWMKEAQ